MADLIVDSGLRTEIVLGYANRLLYASELPDNDESPHLSGNPGAEDGGFLNYSRKRKRSDSYMSVLELNHGDQGIASSVRSVVLDMLLECLNSPTPTVAHLLLGLLETSFDSIPPESVSTGFDAIVTLLLNVDFILSYPDLAERCQHVLFDLISSEATSHRVITRLESSHYDFFYAQLRLVSSLPYNSSPQLLAAELRMRGWLFRSIAVYIHRSLVKDPFQMKKINRLVSCMLSYEERGSLRRNRMVVLRLLDNISINIKPPALPQNAEALAVAERMTAPVGTFFKWLKIDIERFCKELQTIGSPSSMPAFYKRHRGSEVPVSDTEIDHLALWAIQWNVYSQRVAAEAHALNGLSELLGVIILDYMMPTVERKDILWQGLNELEQEEVRLDLIASFAAAVMGKIVEQADIPAQLFELLSRTCLLLVSQLQVLLSKLPQLPESHAKQLEILLERSLVAIRQNVSSAGNTVASRNGRTLLYGAVVSIMSCLGIRGLDERQARRTFSTFQEKDRLSLAAQNAVEILCRDACEGDDTLSMALAVCALEAVMHYGRLGTLKALRERGFVMHFIGVFRKLCDMDAALRRCDAAQSRQQQLGDPAMISAMYGVFLSLFARIAYSPDGASALLEGGLLRVVREMHNLPSNRPRMVNVIDGSALSHKSLQQVEQAFWEKWLPIMRLLSAICSALPNNRALATQLLQFISKTEKVFISALKVNRQSRITLDALRECAYVTFILRYVTTFEDLCEKALSTAKWDKITHLMTLVVIYFGSDMLPVDAEQHDQKSWWCRLVPSSRTEESEHKVRRLANEAHVSTAGGRIQSLLGKMSLFEEDKFFLSRMVLSNAVAYCSSRMFTMLDDQGKLKRGHSPILAIVPGRMEAERSFGMNDNSSSKSPVNPIWTEAASLDDFIGLIDNVVALVMVSFATADDEALRHLIEYHENSATFILENLLMILVTHFAHHSFNPDIKSVLQRHVDRVLVSIAALQGKRFTHAISRRLREISDQLLST